MRPICINHNCGKPAAHDGRRWRVHCGHCQAANYGKWSHAAGVIPYKTGICSNQDGHLGFPCSIDYNIALWAKGMTEVDHKDGNCENNIHKNLDELCPMCHKRKGQLAGDYNNQKKYKTKKVVNDSNSMFNKLFHSSEIEEKKYA